MKRNLNPTPKQQRDRANKIQKRYGITLEEYDKIKAVQSGVCPLCRRAKGLSANLQVDHDHALPAGRDSVRGLLCGRCNNRLGWYESNRDKVDEYLNDWPSRKVL
jgi:hypothetical protein